MNLIKLTNVNAAHLGDPIYINIDWIVSIFEISNEGSLSTVIFGGPQGTTWQVEESPEEIKRIIEKVKL